MTMTVPKIALALLALAAIAPAATGATHEELRAKGDYRIAPQFDRLTGRVCAKGKIEERLDCLGQELYAIKEASKPLVRPMGLPGTE